MFELNLEREIKLGDWCLVSKIEDICFMNGRAF